MKTYISVVVLALTMFLVGCSNDSETRRTLQAAGFTQIQTHGYAWFACSDDDTYATEFTAINPLGEPASGAVCCGMIAKNCTIRY